MHAVACLLDINPINLIYNEILAVKMSAIPVCQSQNEIS